MQLPYSTHFYPIFFASVSHPFSKKENILFIEIHFILLTSRSHFAFNYFCVVSPALEINIIDSSSFQHPEKVDCVKSTQILCKQPYISDFTINYKFYSTYNQASMFGVKKFNIYSNNISTDASRRFRNLIQHRIIQLTQLPIYYKDNVCFHISLHFSTQEVVIK